jgi:hypothetical protein
MTYEAAGGLQSRTVSVVPRVLTELYQHTARLGCLSLLKNVRASLRTTQTLDSSAMLEIHTAARTIPSAVCRPRIPCDVFSGRSFSTVVVFCDSRLIVAGIGVRVLFQGGGAYQQSP